MALILSRVPRLGLIGYCRSQGVRLGLRQSAARFCTPSTRLVNAWPWKPFKEKAYVPNGYRLIYNWEDEIFLRRIHGVVVLFVLASTITIPDSAMKQKKSYDELKEEMKAVMPPFTKYERIVKFMQHFGELIFVTIFLAIYAIAILYTVARLPCKIYYNHQLDTYIATFIRHTFQYKLITIPRKEIEHVRMLNGAAIVKLMRHYTLLNEELFKSVEDFELMARIK